MNFVAVTFHAVNIYIDVHEKTTLHTVTNLFRVKIFSETNQMELKMHLHNTKET